MASLIAVISRYKYTIWYYVNIVVYCGANKGNFPIYEQAAIELGKWIVKSKNRLVYGGGRAGLMGTLADTVLNSGGEVIGVIPTFLQERELAHEGLTEQHIVDSMSERKMKMLALGEVCIALPGGPGTLEEITEMISWSRVGQNMNPYIFYDQSGYYAPLEKMYDSMVENVFLTKTDRDKILFSSSLEEISEFIKVYTPPSVRRY